MVMTGLSGARMTGRLLGALVLRRQHKFRAANGNTLRITASGNCSTVFLNGEKLFETEDRTFTRLQGRPLDKADSPDVLRRIHHLRKLRRRKADSDERQEKLQRILSGSGISHRDYKGVGRAHPYRNDRRLQGRWPGRPKADRTKWWSHPQARKAFICHTQTVRFDRAGSMLPRQRRIGFLTPAKRGLETQHPF